MTIPLDLAAAEAAVLAAIDDARDALVALSLDIHAHPELGLEERYASAALTGFLAARGLEVERGTAGLETAFIARGGEMTGPRIALVAEYDALPELGHACGHNLIGVAAVAAAVGLNAVSDRLPGQFAVVGAPAEELGIGKMMLRDAGVFQTFDAAMMFHAGMDTAVAPTFIGIQRVEYDFHGAASHAASAPEHGASALNAVRLLFGYLDALRQHVRSDSRMSGFVINGGEASNIVPAFSSARLDVRSPDPAYLDVLVRRVHACAEAAALATGTRMESRVVVRIEPLLTNAPMASLFADQLVRLGVPWQRVQADGAASTDMGSISAVLPAIHPIVQIADAPTAWHTPAFRDAAASPRGMEGMLMAAKAMALTALHLLADPARLRAAKDAFAARAR